MNHSSWVSRVFRSFLRHDVIRQPRQTSLGLEYLEERTLLSFGARGDEFPVHTYRTSYQSDPVVAMTESGNFVIAWTSRNEDSPATGIYAKRFNEYGEALGEESLSSGRQATTWLT